LANPEYFPQVDYDSYSELSAFLNAPNLQATFLSEFVDILLCLNQRLFFLRVFFSVSLSKLFHQLKV
jgi:hypothetical protein